MSIASKDFPLPSLLDNLKVQYRVIRALMLRQILLRWGRDNLGYLWLFVEPLILIVVVVGFISIFRGQTLEKAHFGLAAIPFFFLGYSQAMLWRSVSGKCGGAFAGNLPLFEHRFIRPLDVFLSTAFVEILGVTIAVLGIYVVFMMLGLISLPNSVPLMVLGWGLLIWFSLAYGILLGALSGAFEKLTLLVRGLNILFYMTSGVFFAVVWLPPKYRDMVLWVPMVHSTEMLRHAYFGDQLQTFENPSYLILCNTVLTFFALMIARAKWLEDIRE